MLSRYEVLIALHRYNKWLPELLEDDFKYVVNEVLFPYERQILEHKAKGLPDKRIMSIFCLKPNSYAKYLKDIKKKLRTEANHMVEQEVQNFCFKCANEDYKYLYSCKSKCPDKGKLGDKFDSMVAQSRDRLLQNASPKEPTQTSEQPDTLSGE